MTSLEQVAQSTAIPTDCWYAVAESDQVARQLSPVVVAGVPVVLYRTEGGTAVALEDRCVHRPYPLSAGVLRGDTVQCGLCGFRYDASGACVEVPSQPRVPFGAAVAAYPTRESDGLVWIWVGLPGRDVSSRVPALPWLASPEWSTVGGSLEVSADFSLVHEKFADVTQMRFLAPEIAPAALEAAPDLTVTLTEMTVELRRSFPASPSPLPTWLAELSPASADREVLEVGTFYSPGLFVDVWDTLEAGEPNTRMRFSHLVVPVGAGRTVLKWRVSRDFALEDEKANTLFAEKFQDYYVRVATALAAQQQLVDTFGPGKEVNVAADQAGVRIREIINRLRREASRVAPARPTPSATPTNRGEL